MTKSMGVWIADYYLPGCPSNTAGKQIGIGLTHDLAVQDACPWANQAPWFEEKARKILVFDGQFDSTNMDQTAIFHWIEDAWSGSREVDFMSLAGEIELAKQKGKIE